MKQMASFYTLFTQISIVSLIDSVANVVLCAGAADVFGLNRLEEDADFTISDLVGYMVYGRFPESHFPGKTIPGKTFPGKTFPG